MRAPQRFCRAEPPDILPALAPRAKALRLPLLGVFMGEKGSEAPAKPVIRGRRYGRETVVLDGMHFSECRFEGTELIFFGGAVPTLDRCVLNDVAFGFKGPAKNTLDLIKLLMKNGVISGLS
jgi:hypothetical protein